MVQQERADIVHENKQNFILQQQALAAIARAVSSAKPCLREWVCFEVFYFHTLDRTRRWEIRFECLIFRKLRISDLERSVLTVGQIPQITVQTKVNSLLLWRGL